MTWPLSAPPSAVASVRKLALSTALCSALLSGLALAQDNKDSITFKDGKTETGTIKSEEYAGLALAPTKGAPRTIEWPTIAPNGITYAGSPEFTSAKESLDAGKFDEALPKFEELKADAKLRAVLKQNVLYFIPVIQQRKGEWDKAITGYKELVTAFPKSRYLMEVGENLVACYLAKGKDVAGASKALDEISQAAITAGVENSFSSGVNVLKGRLLEEQGKFPEAQAAYSVAEKAGGTISQQARLGMGRCAVQLNKKPEAEQLFRKLVAEDAPNAVMAGAWNGLGDLVKQEGFDKKDTDKLLDALYSYLRGVVQYAPLPGELATEYRRAMQGSVDCFKFLSQLEQNPERKRLYAERAKERAEQLTKEFPK